MYNSWVYFLRPSLQTGLGMQCSPAFCSQHRCLDKRSWRILALPSMVLRYTSVCFRYLVDGLSSIGASNDPSSWSISSWPNTSPSSWRSVFPIWASDKSTGNITCTNRLHVKIRSHLVRQSILLVSWQQGRCTGQELKSVRSCGKRGMYRVAVPLHPCVEERNLALMDTTPFCLGDLFSRCASENPTNYNYSYTHSTTACIFISEIQQQK